MKPPYQRVTCSVDLGINPHLAIEAAMESRPYGIRYWAADYGFVKSRKAWRVREDNVDNSDGVPTGKPGPWLYIGQAAVERACRLMAKQHPLLFARLMDEMKLDAPLGDILVQLAVFGEVKYG